MSGGESFSYDVLVGYGSKDKDAAREVAERLRGDGLRVWFREWEVRFGLGAEAKTESGLEAARVLVLCVSSRTTGSEWKRLEAGTLAFRDPVNKDRRLLVLRLEETPPPQGADLPYIDWTAEARERGYPKLLEVCRAATESQAESDGEERVISADKAVQLEGHDAYTYSFNRDGTRCLTGGRESTISIYDAATGRRTQSLAGHTSEVWRLSWSADERYALSGSDDKTMRLWDVETAKCLRVFAGHEGPVRSARWSLDQQTVLSCSWDTTVKLWEIASGSCLKTFTGHTDKVLCAAWSPDGRRAVSGSSDRTARIWDARTGSCLHTLQGHNDAIFCIEWSPDGTLVLSGSSDNTLRLWDTQTGACVRVLEGHTSTVETLVWSRDGRLVLSGAFDTTVRLWNLQTGRCLCIMKGHAASLRGVGWSSDSGWAVSGDNGGGLRVWNLAEFVAEARAPIAARAPSSAGADQVQYTNAKVLLVGDTSSGKTGLAHRLATGDWKPSESSTVGAWSTQWKLPHVTDTAGLQREIWLWDFGGQADQRLVHQLYMDHTDLVLLLFDADKEDVLPGLREWQLALRRSVPAKTPQLLVAGRIDAGFKASRSKLQRFAGENGFGYYETSALEGRGCSELTGAIMHGIPWSTMERRTSPLIFKLVKDEILKLRDAGQALLTFKELRDALWRQLPADAPRMSDDTLTTVIGLLDGPGAVKELEYGTYVLLQPEWVNTYAQAVIRTLRQDPSELGSLPLRSIADGKLLFQVVGRDGAIEDMKRLTAADERVVLREMERQLEERGLCLRQEDKLVFPSHCGRDRPAVVKTPSVFVSYAVQGYLDDIYATLVVKLAGCECFKLVELWRDAADFATLTGDRHMGIKLARAAAGTGEIGVYFAPGVRMEDQVIFANYIHKHLLARSESVQRLRHYVCPHCGTPKGNPEVLMQKLIDKKEQASVECDKCEKRFDLWDELEKQFASDAVRGQVEALEAKDAIRLDSRRKGKLLALEVTARITSADQKCFEIPLTEDEGLDIELEFTDDKGKGTGKRLYLQLKSGNSHLRARKDGTEVFRIDEQRWVDYWLKQPYPVMLVIGTFAPGEEGVGRDKLSFADVRWMEISSVLRRESRNGKNEVKQLEFKGERLDLSSVRRWREKVLSGSV